MCVISLYDGIGFPFLLLEDVHPSNLKHKEAE
jgi:hypothetical protein